ncbi:ABC transporter permease [Rouxiella badensis]|jgi:NitT/TauT family transport system permease protein|uniref:Sulfonate ABC transporter permease n=2 Tax=Rouxiella badensis TaxID=1646377 RepID=A0A1X0WGT9_9GAMM|nr:ABC transporter permease subunit [Rouxiella badensis]MCC3718020.1 ABC transporter permease subunit [Rouxiella badensis]MCC3727212.1 ABC transporter permease subunit [Rouxiella badensis]MCC3738439.1 ABC transporter permease subunit [Rouxiella badensis]MCC3748911.1 ABC transporter permease subunit [Rouxiella badensis]ORJ25992.1 sulfonate ABC transporter permease [Rouxiella badensis]
MNFRFNVNAANWRLLPNAWDGVAFPLIIGLIAMAAVGFHQTLLPITSLKTQAISLDPANLPEYALRTTLRMLVAMVAALLFSLVYGTLAAKSRRAEKVLVPILDILQSVPVLGYISFTVTFFIALFPGRVLGVELAAIFALFTSQAWNMTFSFYQSLRTVPRDLVEVSRGFHLTAWQRFWKLDVPFAVPGLIWNMMMSMSGGWFFIVASEAITVGNNTFTLPGIGGYLAEAILNKNIHAVGWVLLTMTVVILAYDQLLFRPLVAWADKFRMENTRSSDAPTSWVLDLMRQTRLIHQLLSPIGLLLSLIARIPLRLPTFRAHRPEIEQKRLSRWGDIVWSLLVILLTVYVAYRVISYVQTGVTLGDVGHVLVLGLITLLRVTVLIFISSIIWVPLGVMIGLRPGLAGKIQPIAQFLAAFPANLLFPAFVIVIVHFHLNPDIWLSPLIVLGTQWYILFNVVAGTTAFPNDYREAAANFHIRGWQWWKQVMLPGIFPYYITGAITASGGAWNASIVSELVQWGDTKVTAHGLGAYIAQTTAAGDFPKIILGIAVMALFVTLFNRLLWRPLYAYAESRFRAD